MIFEKISGGIAKPPSDPYTWEGLRRPSSDLIPEGAPRLSSAYRAPQYLNPALESMRSKIERAACPRSFIPSANIDRFLELCHCSTLISKFATNRSLIIIAVAWRALRRSRKTFGKTCRGNMQHTACTRRARAHIDTEIGQLFARDHRAPGVGGALRAVSAVIDILT